MAETRVLVVDDEPTVREVVVGYLRRDDHEVADACGDGDRPSCPDDPDTVSSRPLGVAPH
ncbi:MAG: hypothetical protein P8O03_06145 [Ilumatobacter sp.]|nr:hypothetical protein [Ilumatobacter sp.]